MKNLFRTVAITLFLSIASGVTIAAADDLAAAAACENLILDYGWHWDHNNHEDFANLFTEDASFRAAGRVHNGRDEILVGQMKRTTAIVTRMVLTNVRVKPTSSAAATATSYMMVHSEAAPKDAAAGRPGTISTRGFRILGEMAFTCELTDAGWRIASVNLTPVFDDENLSD